MTEYKIPDFSEEKELINKLESYRDKITSDLYGDRMLKQNIEDCIFRLKIYIKDKYIKTIFSHAELYAELLLSFGDIDLVI